MIVNESLPNWVKIGRTNNPERRIKEFNTASPTKFRLHSAWVTNNEVLAEKLCHDALISLRAKSGSEFFSISTKVEEITYECEDTGQEYVDFEYPLGDLADYIEYVLFQNGITFEHALFPGLDN